jgi:hypothetical protein
MVVNNDDWRDLEASSHEEQWKDDVTDVRINALTKEKTKAKFVAKVYACKVKPCK